MAFEILQQTFEVAEKPGLDTFDPRLAEVSDLGQQGEFQAASDQVTVLLEEGICDVRLLGFLCFAPFSDQGPHVLPDMFSGLTRVFEENWEAFGPTKIRAKVVKKSLGWLFKQIDKKIKWEEDHKDDTWRRWVGSTTTDDIDDAQKQARFLQRAVDEALGDKAGSILDDVGKLVRWLDGFRVEVYVPEPEEPEEEEVPEEDPEDLEEFEEFEESPADQAPPSPTMASFAQPPSAGPAFGVGAQAQGSVHLQILQQKLDAFATLVEQGKLLQAVVVSDDLAEIIESFDPTLYFPSLFSRYLSLMIQHANEIYPLQEARGMPSWQNLKRLYQADLASFVGLHVEVPAAVLMTDVEHESSGLFHSEDDDDF